MRRLTAVRGAAVAACVLTTALLPGCSSSAPAAAAPPRTTSAAPSAGASPTPTATPTATATATATSTPAGVDARVAAALAGMDRRAQVAQLFLVGVPLKDLPAGAALARGGVGGIFLAGRSTASAADLAAITGSWAADAPGPRPWVATDQEGGQVQALSGPGFARLPSARDQGQLPPAQLTALADGMGASLRSAGVTVDLAPVVDVVPAGTEQGNPPIGVFDRQYGSTAAQVVPAAGAVVDGLAAHGVTATLKHFPGLGRVGANTDTTAGVTDPTLGPDDPQVQVYAALTRDRPAPFVMVSLAIYPQLDGTQPAAFSPAVITSLLRDRLGYAGVVVSDDLGSAKAVAAVDPGQRAVRFLTAGGTLVLTNTATVLPAMEDAVLARDAADPAFAARIDAAVHTALVAKARAGLLGH